MMALARWVFWILIAVITLALLGPSGLWPLALFVPFLTMEVITERSMSLEDELFVLLSVEGK